MKLIPIGMIVGVVYLLFAGCVSIPPEVVTSSESLGRYASKLGASSVKIVNEYDARLAHVTSAMTRTSEYYIREYENDVNRLVKQLVDQDRAFDEMAQELDYVLKADPATQLSSLYNVVKADMLKKKLKSEIEARPLRQKERSQIENPEDFKTAHRRLQETQNSLDSQHKKVRDALNSRLASDYAGLDRGFAELTAYLRSLITLVEERKRVLGTLGTAAEKLSDSADLKNGMEKVESIFKTVDDLTIK